MLRQRFFVVGCLRPWTSHLHGPHAVPEERLALWSCSLPSQLEAAASVERLWSCCIASPPPLLAAQQADVGERNCTSSPMAPKLLGCQCHWKQPAWPWGGASVKKPRNETTLVALGINIKTHTVPWVQMGHGAFRLAFICDLSRIHYQEYLLTFSIKHRPEGFSWQNASSENKLCLNCQMYDEGKKYGHNNHYKQSEYCFTYQHTLSKTLAVKKRNLD